MASIDSTRKKQALGVLPAGRLRELVDACYLRVGDRRSRSDLVGALADGRRFDFGFVLEGLGRGELQQMCDELRLHGGSESLGQKHFVQHGGHLPES